MLKNPSSQDTSSDFKDVEDSLLKSSRTNSEKVDTKTKDEELDTNYNQRLRKSILLYIGGVVLGIADAVRGPTLLDLRDMVNTDIPTISYMLMLQSLGLLAGCTICGFLLDHFVQHSQLVMWFFMMINGLSNIALPFSQSVSVMYGIGFIFGVGSGAFNLGTNVVCINIWRGYFMAPYIHIGRFAFSLGAFLAPLISKGFISDRIESHVNATIGDPKNTTKVTNEHLCESEDEELVDGCESRIDVLYILVGAIMVTVSIGFLIYGFSTIMEIRKHKKIHQKDPDTKKAVQVFTKNVIIFVSIMSFFNFCLFASEICFYQYLTTFSVENNLKLPKQMGANITAIYWGGFALTRFLAIFFAIKLKPGLIIISSLACQTLSCILMMSGGDKSLIVLQIGAALMGIGQAAVYASHFVWMEQFIVVSNRIMAIFGIIGYIGSYIFPILIGQYIKDQPMMFTYSIGAITFATVLSFFSANIVSRAVLKENHVSSVTKDGDS